MRTITYLIVSIAVVASLTISITKYGEAKIITEELTLSAKSVGVTLDMDRDFVVSNIAQVTNTQSYAGCENKEYGFNKYDDPFLLKDCKILLAIRNHWLDDSGNSHLGAGHALRSWGVGDIESWSGIEIDLFPVDNEGLRDNCGGNNKGCVKRVVSVDLSVSLGSVGFGKIAGTIPDDFGELSALVYLNLGNNLLYGGIPSALGNVSEPYCNQSQSARYIDFPLDPPFFDFPNYHFPRSEIELGNKDCRAGSVRRGSSGRAVSGNAVNGASSSADTGSSLGQRTVSGQSDEDNFSLFAAGEFLQRRMPKISLETDKQGSRTSYYLQFTAETISDVADVVDLAEKGSELGRDFSRLGSKASKTFKLVGKSFRAASKVLGYVTGPIEIYFLLEDAIKLFDGLANVEHPPHLDPERSQLIYLDLSNNRLSSSLPHSFGNLDKIVYLYLENNNFSGSIPSGIGMGGRSNGIDDTMKYLNFSSNRFTGGIPDVLSYNLDYIDLSENDLSGSMLWKAFSPITGLIGLYLNDNNFQTIGSIPQGKLTPRMSYLDLSGNSFSGAVPSKIGTIVRLRELNLSDNNFSTLSKLEVPFAPNASPLHRFQYLDLSGNKFVDISGLATNVSIFLTLRYLNLRDNNITTLPQSKNGEGMLRFSTDLEFLYLGGNALKGNIEDFVPIGKLKKLLHLDISRNQLSGGIPSDIESLTKLVGLDLSHNRLTGKVPNQLARLLNLVLLDISHNCLTGELPDGIANSRKWILLKFDGNECGTKPMCEDGVSGDPASENQCSGDGCSGGILVSNPDANRGLVADCEALLALQEKWGTDLGWGTGNISSWEGIEIGSNRITGLRLSGKRISGAIPADIGKLTALTVMDLSRNSLSGGLPFEMRNIANLTSLDLSGNKLRGGIPSWITTLTAFEFLDLSNNQFSGNIPSGLGRLTSLTDLDFSNNHLDGVIPTSLGNLSSLEFLDLSENKLSGNIPRQIGNLNLLERLLLSDNRLSGGIPANLGNLNLLSYRGLDLRRNCLLRPVPEAVKQLGSSVVRVEHNFFLSAGDNPDCDPCADGTFIPGASFADLALVHDCRWMIQASRKLHGTSGIPASSRVADWGTAFYTNLRRWPGVGVRSGRVTSLNLSVLTTSSSIDRRLSGRIPVEFTALGGLERLNLSNNRFRGNIPVQIGSLGRLVSLNLSRNLLSGSIPEDIGDIETLEILNLSHNRLSGTIPELLGQSKGGDKQLIRMYLNDNNLSGPIPEVLGNLAHLTVLYMHQNCLVGRVPETLDSVADLKWLPNKPECSNMCSDGSTVTDPQTNDKLVEDCLSLLSAREWWAEKSSLSPEASISRWGTGAESKIQDWPGVTVSNSRGVLRIVELDLSHNGLKDGIPEELGSLDGLVSLDLSSNQLSGSIPEHLYKYPNLLHLDLSNNEMSGAINGAFQSIEMKTIDLSDNEFSGRLPNLVFPEVLELKVPHVPQTPSDKPQIQIELENPENGLRMLTYLDLSDNQFSGSIPAGYEAFADGRPMRYLNLSHNQITDNLPMWISQLTFSDDSDYRRTANNQLSLEDKVFEISLESNRLCTLEGYKLQDLKRSNGTSAPVNVKLGNNECPENDFESMFIPGPITASRASASRSNSKNLVVRWAHPRDPTGLRYIVEPVLNDSAPQGLPDGESCRVVTSGTTVTITTAISKDCQNFDAIHYTVDITPVYAPSGSSNRYFGNTANTNKRNNQFEWLFRTIQENTTPLAIYQSLGLEADNIIAQWVTGDRTWKIYRNTDRSFGSYTLKAGATIAILNTPLEADLTAAKLGSADSDTPVLLQNGWNFLAAGGTSVRQSANSRGFLFDSKLINCNDDTGVIAIWKIDYFAREAEAEYPCNHKTTRERTYPFLDSQGRQIRVEVGTLNRVNEFDTVVIFWGNPSPVEIIWDRNKYIRNTR